METDILKKDQIIVEDENVGIGEIVDKFPQKSCCENVKSIYRNITIEPTAFLMIFASFFATLSTQTLILEKACRVSLQLGDEICTSLRLQNVSNSFSQYEEMVQQLVAPKLIWKSAIESALPCVILIFVGAWSDKTGRRKVLMFAPLVGEILACTSNILNVIFFYQMPIDVLIFLDAFLKSITGAFPVMTLALFSYIVNITKTENRTHRIGVVSLSIFAGTPLGLALSGIILQRFGYYATFGTSLIIHVLNIIYTYFRVIDPPRSAEQKMHDNQGFCYFLKTFFDISTVKVTAKVLYKKTPNNRRLHLIILICTLILVNGPVYGEMSVVYLLTRYRFNWDEFIYSIFQTYSFVVNIFGILLSLLILSKWLKWHDSVLGILSATSKISSSFVYAFAPNAQIFFIAPLIDCLTGVSQLAIRSIYSKLVEPNELGKINSIVGVIESILPVVFTSIYTQLYISTMNILPGAIYLVGAVIYLPVMAVFLWLFYEHRKGKVQEDAEKNDNDNKASAL